MFKEVEIIPVYLDPSSLRLFIPYLILKTMDFFTSSLHSLMHSSFIFFYYQDLNSFDSKSFMLRLDYSKDKQGACIWIYFIGF